jgi:uncharacterized protein (DUF111 family)
MQCLSQCHFTGQGCTRASHGSLVVTHPAFLHLLTHCLWWQGANPCDEPQERPNGTAVWPV